MLKDVVQIEGGRPRALIRVNTRLLGKIGHCEPRVTAQYLGDSGAVGGDAGHCDMLAHNLPH
jgi:hypothetical protein